LGGQASGLLFDAEVAAAAAAATLLPCVWSVGDIFKKA
jgi:hypothetical protein